jgi:tetratricopeptide (TPR) repeat protein
MDLDEKPKAPKAKKGGKKNVDIDLDEQSSAQQGPVSAGAPSEAFGRAKKLFDKEKWSDAATGMYQVVSGASGDDEGNKQMAQYYLAICLYRLKFYQASYSIFSVIADNKFHLKFGETLLWLAKLATQLPEPADIIERVGKYSDEEVARFDNAQQQELYWTLNYMLGRFKYRNRQYEESIRLFQKVDRRSEHYVQAQFFTGVSYVQKRQSIPAVKSFQRIEKALEEGVSGVEE